ncbi:N-acetyltransferase 9 [Geranomyces michiganensis]|nr:N-acetyltransferase 9 [Geranomyces michiganensis]
MIGDVNLYFTSKTTAEIEIMIAEPHARGKSHGKTALLLMMYYANSKLGVAEFFARIANSNEQSVKLFRDKLGFVFAEESTYFKETTFVARGEVIVKALSGLAGVKEEAFEEDILS